MHRQVSIASMSVGVMAIVGGICAIVFGCLGRSTRVQGLGPLDGYWSGTEYFTLGTILAVVGSGLFTFGLLNRRAATDALR